MNSERLIPSDAGCWIDGHWGRYAITNLLAIAESEGWPGMDAELASAIRCNDAEFCSDSCCCQEIIVSAADEAEAWMNANLAPAGYSFGWHDGEFFLWSDESWEDF